MQIKLVMSVIINARDTAYLISSLELCFKRPQHAQILIFKNSRTQELNYIEN